MQTRRRFLKTTGVAMAGSLAIRANGASGNVSPDPSCDFTGLPKGFVYLNSGTEGTMPDCVLSVFQNGLQRYTRNPTTSYETDPVFGKHQEQNRERVAAFLRVGRNNICLTDNTTMGLNMTLMGLNFGRDDTVVTTNHEHTAIRSPLRVLQERQGLRIVSRAFPSVSALRHMNAVQLLAALFPDIEALRGAKALCVSHVYPGTGLRLPLKALRQKVDQLGIRYLVVDGAQAMGMLDLTAVDDDIRHCDFYAFPGHKWLNGPPSTGVLYIRNENIRPPEFYPTLSQRMEKYDDCDRSEGHCFPMAEALQVRGNSNTPGFAAMVSAMEFIESAGGASGIEQHILGLSESVKQFIVDRSPDSIVSPYLDHALSSGLSVFYPFRWTSPEKIFTDKKTADRVVAELLKKNIQVRSIGFQDSGAGKKPSGESFAIRISTAHFNTTADVEKFKSALGDVLSRITT